MDNKLVGICNASKKTLEDLDGSVTMRT